MPILKRDNVKTSLSKKGFKLQDGTHHIYFHYIVDGKDVGISTHVSHSKSGKDIRDTLQNKMKRQLKLGSMKQFRDLVNCPMNKEDYEQYLRDNGYLD